MQGILSLQLGGLLVVFHFQLALGSPVCSPSADVQPLSLLQIATEKGQLAKEKGQAWRTVMYEPEKWNNVLPLRKSHNCYEYMLNDVDNVAVKKCNRFIQAYGRNSNTYKKCKHYFHIPGYHWHQKGRKGPHDAVKFNRSSVTCPNVMQRVALDGMGSLQWASKDGHATRAVDNRGVKSWRHDDQCPPNHYMGSLVIKPHRRFHFYRRDRPCTDPHNKGKLCWSHKPGLLNATHLDASNKEIPDLHAADRSYGNRKSYTSVCGFFCIPANGIVDTHSDFFRGQQEGVHWATV